MLADRRGAVEHVADAAAQQRRRRTPSRRCSADLLADGEQQLDARRARAPRARRAASSASTATAALLSAPRIAVVGVLPAAVARRPARSARAAAPCRGGRRAGCEPLAGPGDPREQVAAVAAERGAGAVLVDLEAERRAARAITPSAHARSLPDGLAIRHSAANVSCSRPRSASLAALTARGSRRLGAGRGAAARARAPRRRTRGTAAPGARARLELGVELRGDEERVVGELDDLDQALVRRGAGDHEPGGLEPLAQLLLTS